MLCYIHLYPEHSHTFQEFRRLLKLVNLIFQTNHNLCNRLFRKSSLGKEDWEKIGFLSVQIHTVINVVFKKNHNHICLVSSKIKLKMTLLQNFLELYICKSAMWDTKRRIEFPNISHTIQEALLKARRMFIMMKTLLYSISLLGELLQSWPKFVTH